MKFRREKQDIPEVAKLKGFLTEELQTLNMDMVTVKTESSSSVSAFLIWDILQLDDHNFQVLYSVRQLVTAVTYDTSYDYVEEPSMNKVYNSETGGTELSYYVKDNVLTPVNMAYEFGGIINPVYSAKDGQVTARLIVSYYDTATMTTQISQYALTLEKSSTGNYMIMGSGMQ